MRPIDADELINNLAKAIPYIIDDAVTDAYVEGLGRAKIEIESMPTIEPKTGKWMFDGIVWKCSKCGGNPTKGMGYVQGNDELYAFCPNCGAKMEVEE